MSKVLVVDFSVSGVTEKIAQKIAIAAQSDLFNIEPEKPYETADVNWRDQNSRATVESKDRSILPGIKNKIPDFSQYDTIFLGFPIWWHTCPNIILTFVKEYDLKGKTVIPFATSGGSGIDKAEKELKSLVPGAKWLPGKVFNNGPSQETVTAWVKDIL